MNAEERDLPVHPSWAFRHRWKIALALAAVAGGVWWGRRDPGRRIQVDPVSEHWLAEHMFESGQRPSE
jgi:hypothetical protein